MIKSYPLSSFLLILTILMIFGSHKAAAQDNSSGSFLILNGTTSPLASSGTPSSSSATSLNSATHTTVPTSPVVADTVTLAPATFATPVCSNSTCITSQIIRNAKQAHVDNSPVKTYAPLLQHNSNCEAPVPTGLTVFRQVVERGSGRIVKYNDAFCLNQGCVYFGSPSAEECK